MSNDTGKIVVAGALVAGGLYLLSRQQRGLPLFGGFGPSLNQTPQSPSPLAPTQAGTNPLTALLTGIQTTIAAIATKTSGNARTIGSTSSGAQGPSTPYYKPPATAPSSQGPTAQAPMLTGFPTAPVDTYLPQAGDPNYGGYDPTTQFMLFGGNVPAQLQVIDPAQWAWTLPADANYIPPPPGA